ncbi:Rap1a/Tai family immunity protein [uncultured Oxalicibacterium sp.]|uniref:Rap1a/Tai family immunity protein n=1 Tax=uncultured Oxalicibacterium sp. TaxID=1168540 RepID=UPI0025CB9018|nr:Rap1a/Tai family immunity protein [uncultured Oxalicibacterium sp.]
MRKKLITFGAMMLVMSSLCQAEENRTWHLTGSELIAALEGKRLSELSDADMRRLFSNAYGGAYVLGVADQTQGSIWCPPSLGILPHELNDRVYTYLSDLPAKRQKENAAPLVAEALRHAFPCKRGSARN